MEPLISFSEFLRGLFGLNPQRSYFITLKETPYFTDGGVRGEELKEGLLYCLSYSPD